MERPDWWHQEPKRSWLVCQEKHFTVEVVAWTRGNEWHWNVYAYVFETHDLFDKPRALMSAPLHGGCTYDARTVSEPAQGIKYEWQRTQTTIKVGSDYGHLYDSEYARMHPQDGVPASIVNDANELAEWLRHPKEITA